MVPNVPCGVESLDSQSLYPLMPPALFLMYRVELKGKSRVCGEGYFLQVPNVPCGVESLFYVGGAFGKPWFLMYRVELKEAR